MSLYNTPIEYIKESIDSILAQTYKNFELIIIDDGTKKEEIEFVESYQDNRIKIYHNETNMGLERSLNKGVELAKSDYIVRMDTDDIAFPERFEKQVEFILDNPQYSLVGTRVDIFNEKDGIYGESKLFGEVKKENFLIGPPFVHPTLLIKKHALQEIGGYPLYKRCEDYAMEFEMYCHGYKGYILEEKLLKYRVVNSYKKRDLNNLLRSCKIRWIYFRKLKMKWYQYIYIIKPLATGKIFWFFKDIINKIRKENKK